MHTQSIMLELGLSEFIIQGTAVDRNGDMLVVKPNCFPHCTNCGEKAVSLHDRRKQLNEDRPIRDQRVFLICEKRRFRSNSCGALVSDLHPSL